MSQVRSPRRTKVCKIHVGLFCVWVSLCICTQRLTSKLRKPSLKKNIPFQKRLLLRYQRVVSTHRKSWYSRISTLTWNLLCTSEVGSAATAGVTATKLRAAADTRDPRGYTRRGHQVHTSPSGEGIHEL